MTVTRRMKSKQELKTLGDQIGGVYFSTKMLYLAGKKVILVSYNKKRFYMNFSDNLHMEHRHNMPKADTRNHWTVPEEMLQPANQRRQRPKQIKKDK